MKLSKYIACICEGAAEQTIINILLDAKLLIFERKNLLDNEIIRYRSAEKFEQQYLRKGFDAKISVIRVLDSRREKFALSKAYQHKVDVINVITSPEIEMIVIFSEEQYDNYKKSGMKPSEFCKKNLKLRYVKSEKFLVSYFCDPTKLLYAINEYKRVSNIPKGEYTLNDLLKKNTS